jgi:5-oxoprolinase (ATP-hydrolysing)
VKRIGVDVGGTFTDIMFWDDATSRVAVHKLPSTPDDPSRAMMAGLREIGDAVGTALSSVDQLLHGTTVATNMVLERKGSRAGMVTTRGFRDVIYIGRHRRPHTFSIYQDLPWREPTLVSRADRRTVTEKVAPPDGEVLVELDEDEVRDAARHLREAGAESVAVCFLFSFLNPDHERRAREILEAEMPGVYVCASHEVIPLHREYERFSTACLNAYIAPKTSRYIAQTHRAMADEAPGTDFRLMASNGGTVTVDGAVASPASLLMSGPSAGVVGGIWIGRQAGVENLITLDVGGTSADIAVAPGGQLRMRHLYDTQIGGYDVMLPMVDVDTIGAGGGSIARVDAGGLLRVGPESAGAYPGPVCYGRSGTTVAATDAQIALGRLRPETFLGGRMEIEPESAVEAIRRQIAEPLEADVDEAAMGVVRILTHNMVRAIELNSVRKGYDPREFSLVAFGGAGPAFACDIAQELSIPQVIVPRHPGVTSALGLLASELKYEIARTVMTEAAAMDPAAMSRIYEELEAEGRARLLEDGIAEEHMLLQRWADCRYTGQAYELLVGVDPGRLDRAGVERVEEAFHERHEREYFWRFTEKPVQIVHLRVYALGGSSELSAPEIEAGAETPPDDALVARRDVCFEQGGGATRLDTPFYDVTRLEAGNVVEGPAIIEQEDATTTVNPGLEARVDAYGNLVIEAGKA